METKLKKGMQAKLTYTDAYGNHEKIFTIEYFHKVRNRNWASGKDINGHWYGDACKELQIIN